jgi:hypothetical protein
VIEPVTQVQEEIQPEQARLLAIRARRAEREQEDKQWRDPHKVADTLLAMRIKAKEENASAEWIAWLEL